MFKHLIGPCDIRFVGHEKFVQVNIDTIVQDKNNHVVHVLGKDGAIYNWSNIIVIRKART
jgi:hypothetical protein